jgi:hypothetical protein
LKCFRDMSYKRHKGKFSFSNKTIDKSIPATRCRWYPFSKIEEKKIMFFNSLRFCNGSRQICYTLQYYGFSQFFLYGTFFFLAQLYQRHDLLPRTIQYNMYKFSNSTKYPIFLSRLVTIRGPECLHVTPDSSVSVM